MVTVMTTGTIKFAATMVETVVDQMSIHYSALNVIALQGD